MESFKQVWDSGNFIEKLRNRAELDVPEWKLDLEEPDIGTVLAVLFADMMEATNRRFYQAVRQYPVQLYNMLDAELLPSGQARGYVTFQTVNDEVAGAFIPKTTKIIGVAQENVTVSFETCQDVFVSPSRLKEIRFVDGDEDSISQPIELPVPEQELINCQSHRMYIGHGFLFFIETEGSLILDFNAEPEQLEGISWAYSCGEEFMPFDSCRYEEGRLVLYKNRKQPACRKAVYSDRECFWLRAETGPMGSGTELVFSGLSIYAKGSRIEPDIIYDGNIELVKDEFLPFGSSPYLFQEVYFCCGEVFSKKGARITLTFDLDFLEIEGEIKTPETPKRWRAVMRKSEFPEKSPVNVHITSVSFEYYNGLGFTGLPGTAEYSVLFDGTEKEGKKTIIFQCPEDICPYLVAAHETWCIRLRIAGLSAAYPVDGVYCLPRMKHMLLSYDYEGQGKTAEYVICTNQLETKFLPPAGQLRPFYNYLPSRRILYLAFTQPLNEEQVSILFETDGVNNKKNSCWFEYYTHNDWHSLNVLDGTNGLTRTGTLSFLAANDFAEHTFFNCRGYWVRILWKDKIYPRLKGIHINSAEVIAEPGSGSLGNLPAGALNTLERSIGFVNKVENKEALAGGFDWEQTHEAIRRNAAAFRHRDRAVTARDIEDIVIGGVRNILQVKCFSGYNERGEKVPGHITLVVLPQQGELYFERIQKNVSDCLAPYIHDQLLLEGRLHIVEPAWVPLKAHMTISASSSANHYRLKEEIKEHLNNFLSPLTGNFDKKGWEIGTVPTCIQLENACKQLKGVKYIKHISMDFGAEVGIYALGTGKEHEIIIEE